MGAQLQQPWFILKLTVHNNCMYSRSEILGAMSPLSPIVCSPDHKWSKRKTLMMTKFSSMQCILDSYFCKCSCISYYVVKKKCKRVKTQVRKYRWGVGGILPPIFPPVGKSEGSRKIEAFRKKLCLTYLSRQDFNFPTALRFSDYCVFRLNLHVS